ncbi:MAG: Sec-independent protein translocase TatB [Kineosporiaceae bacterium]
MFGINPWEFTVLVIVALVVLGPERLPGYAMQLARLVRQVRQLAAGAGEQMRQELGPEFDDIDWRKLDPRQYDPRRIVREALSDSFDVDDPLGLKSAMDPGMKPRSAGGPAAAPVFDDDLGWPREPETDDSPGASPATPSPGAGPSTSGPAGGAAAQGRAGAGAADLPFDPDAT